MGPDAIPEALADLLLVRLDQLDDDARHVVRAASVSGRRVPHLLLDRVLDGQVGSLDVALRAAVERNVLVPMGGDGYAFRHALLAEAVYDDLLPGERVRLHAAYAKALQQGGVGGTAAELARHARAANDLATAARASVAAGDEAMAVAGPDEAARHYELALELATDTDIDGIDVVELTAKACEAALAAGQTYRALALARDQLRATSPDTHPHARLRLLRVKASVAIVADSGADPLMNTTEALELLEKHPDDTLRAQILALHARALWEARRLDEAAAVAAEAMELADRLGLAGVVADARTTLARLRERSGETAASRAILEETVDQARAAGDLAAELRSMFNLGTLQYESGDVAAARETYARHRAAWPRGGSAVGAVRAGVTRPRHPGGVRARRLGRRGRAWPTSATTPRRTWPRRWSGPAAWWCGPGAVTCRPWTCCRRWRRTGSARAWWRCSPASRPSTCTATTVTWRPPPRRTTTSSSSVGGMWGNKDFQARIRLSALLLGHVANAAASTGSQDRAGLVDQADELRDAARRAVRLREESVWDEGPEALAWLARVDAEHARVRWLAGSDGTRAGRPGGGLAAARWPGSRRSGTGSRWPGRRRGSSAVLRGRRPAGRGRRGGRAGR